MTALTAQEWREKAFQVAACANVSAPNRAAGRTYCYQETNGGKWHLCFQHEAIAAALADAEARGREERDERNDRIQAFLSDKIVSESRAARAEGERAGRTKTIHGIFVHNDSWTTSGDDPNCERCRALRVKETP